MTQEAKKLLDYVGCEDNTVTKVTWQGLVQLENYFKVFKMKLSTSHAQGCQDQVSGC